MPYIAGLLAILLTLAASARPTTAMSVVCRLWRTYGRRELRLHELCAVPGHPFGQWRLLQTESMVSALPTADDIFPSSMALTIFYRRGLAIRRRAQQQTSCQL
jgi:hypothetical protein